MAHYLKNLKGSDKDPINSGDMKSWFFYYKWRPAEDDLVFFPFKEDEFPEIKEGDTLWFEMDFKVVGKTVVNQVMIDYANDKKEVWFKTAECVGTKKDTHVAVNDGPVSPDIQVVLEDAVR